MANSDEAVIRWIHATIGIGKVRIFEPRQKQHHRSYVLDVYTHGDAWGFLMVIEPYLKIKRLKAQAVITFYNLRYQKSQTILGG